MMKAVNPQPIENKHKFHQSESLPMKLVTLLIALLAGATQTWGQALPVTVSAKLITQHDDPKGSIDEVVNQALQVDLRAGSQVSGTVKIVCSLYADDLKTKKVVLEKNETLSAELSPGRTVKVSSPPVTFKFTPEHSEKSGSGKRTRYRKVEAVGHRYHGWAVQLFVSEKLVGEAYSTPGLKKRD
jgi:hypothetical protein